MMVGDVVGKVGRLASQEWIPILKKEHSVDCTIVNAENAAAGIGITPEIATGLLELLQQQLQLVIQELCWIQIQTLYTLLAPAVFALVELLVAI